MAKKLTRSQENRMIAGICGGLGEYFDIDPLIVRLGFIAMFLFIPAGIGFILFYIIGALVTPLAPK